MSEKVDDFVHVHLHSEFSALDGLGRIPEYVKEAKDRGNRAIGLSDHGTCRGFMALQEASKKAGIKAIYGSEFYVSQDMHRRGLTDEEKADITKGLKAAEGKAAIKKYEEEHGIRDRWHLGVYAKDNEGLKNLFRLSSASYLDGFYYKPRIDLDELIKYGEGLMVTTGCLASPINDSFLLGRRKESHRMFDKLSEAFDERLWIEIQPHAIREQRIANEEMLKMRMLHGKKHRLLATQDAHYLKKEDAEHHELLLCIGTNDHLSNPDRFRFDGDEFFMKNRSQMYKTFQRNHEFIPSQFVKEALNSTMDFADMCTAEIKTDYHATLLPDPGIPKKYKGDAYAYLKDLCLDGWTRRNVKWRISNYATKHGITVEAAFQVYKDRLSRELLQLKKQRFIPYFLIIHDMYRFCREKEIQMGPGRGSSGGSLVMYLIGCTAVDPLEHDLMFERFVAPWRIDMPDADCFVPGILVETDKGSVPIENLKPGDMALTAAGLRTIAAVHARHHDGEVVALRLDDGREICQTANHELFLSDGTSKRSEHIEVGDELCLLKSASKLEVPMVQETISSEDEKARLLLAMLPQTVWADKPQSAPSDEELRMVPKSVRSQVRETEVLRLDVRQETHRNDSPAWSRERWISGRSGPLRKELVGGGLRSDLETSGDQVQVRTGHNQTIERPIVHSGLLGPELEELCRIERLAWARQEEIEASSSSLPCSQGSNQNCLLVPIGSFGSSEQAQSLESRNVWSCSAERRQNQDNELRLVQARFPSCSGSETALLRPPVRSQSEVSRAACCWETKAAISSRPNGKTVLTVWATDGFLSLRQKQEVLLNDVSEPIVQKAKVVEIYRFAYRGLVHTLSVPGPNAYVANGVYVRNCDIEHTRRGEVIQYFIDKYGRENVCQMATFGKLSGKSCLKDISRVLEIPLGEVSAITSSIIERSSGDERASATIEDSFQQFDACRQFNKKYPKVLHHAKRLEGLVKNLGIHAAGIIASPVPLTDILPLEVRTSKEQKVIVSAYEMYGVAANGLVKVDLLGLKELSIIRACIKEVKRRHDVTLDLESTDVDLNDPKVLKAFTDHDYGGIFQYDTPSANKICAGVRFDSFEDVAALIALNRPGTARSGLAGKFVERKRNPELAKKVHHHPAVSEITKDAMGIMIYQEHVLKIFTQIAGFAPATADSLRKVIAKKIGDETLGKERENFINGAMEKTPGMTPKIANAIMNEVTFFGSYGFSKTHSVEYGLLSYWGMYLKIHWPLEFYCAVLKIEEERNQIQQLAKDAKKHGLKILPPHVSWSKREFAIDDKENAIRGSLSGIKGVGNAAADAIMKVQPFKDIFDFYDRIERRKVNKRVVESLAKAGAFDGLIPNTKWFVEHLNDIWPSFAAPGKRLDLQKRLGDSGEEPDYSAEDRALVSAAVNPLAFGKHPVDAYRSFLKRQIKMHMPDASDPDFLKKYDHKAALVAGIVVDIEYNQIGDFHSGRAPDEDERKRQFWGSPYANVTIETRGGEQHRVRFDIEIFDKYRPIIDRSVGKVLLIFASVADSLGTRAKLGARFAMDVEAFRTKVNSATEELDLWEKIVSGDHPTKLVKWKSKAALEDRWCNKSFFASKGGGTFCGVICHVKPKYDKKGQLMAFFGIIDGAGGYVDVVCFHHVWKEAEKYIKLGRLMKIQLERKYDRERGHSYFFSGGVIKRLI